MSLQRATAPDPISLLPEAPEFTVESNDIQDGQPMAATFAHPSAGGDNLSPHLIWFGNPHSTASFAVTCFDPDAPTGSGFWHWVAFNIHDQELLRGASGAGMPEGAVEVRNDFGELGYGGAAPPAGDIAHRYVFCVYALDIGDLGLDSSATPAYVGFNLTFHTIGRAVIRPTFQVAG